MRLLALETATLEVGAAMLDGDEVIASCSARPGRLHVETLHPAIERVVSESRLEPADIDAIAVDVGPGLFTGLRVGIAAAKALGLALSVPIVAVRSTEALREMARAMIGGSSPFVGVVDMRRGEIAWELPDGSLGIGPETQFAAALSRLGKDVCVVGDGCRRLSDEFYEKRKIRVAKDDALLAPSAEAVGRLGVIRLRRGESEDATSVAPVYLRAADASVNFETRAALSTGVRR